MKIAKSRQPFSRAAFLMAAALLQVVVHSTLANPLVGDTLKVGPATGTGANNVGTSFSGAIGEGNDVSTALDSLAVGVGNQVSADFSLAVGISNSLFGDGGVAFGWANVVGGWHNFSIGMSNEVTGGVNLLVGGWISLDETSEGTVASGIYNAAVGASMCLIAGTNNVINGAIDSAAIGHGLILTGAASRVVLGQYNLGDEVDALLVVGNGNGIHADPGERGNAFTVFANGDAAVSGVLRVNPAGDIPMFVP